jgi:sugar/nucleoside kinase (ribokinase family)
MPLRPKGLFVGLATVDLIYTVEAIPRRNEKISVPGQQVSAGGPATNAAVTFVFLGGRAELVTAVGSHRLAAVIRQDLRAHSVRLHDVALRNPAVPPLSSILVHRKTGDRTVASANATVFDLPQGQFDPVWLRGASTLLVDGHYIRLCIAAAHAARAEGIRVVLDSGSWKKGMDELLPLVDIAICSADYRPPKCRSTNDVFEFFRARSIRQVAITRGASAIRFEDDGKHGSVPVANTKTVDTLGAGDIFHGAFCFYTSEPGTSFPAALAKAARIASCSCRYSGTREWMKIQQSGARG